MQITETYYKARHEAIEWLNSKNRNFTQGVQILINSGYKPIVAGKIAKWGDIPHSREKLVYEIRQMIQVWANPNDPKFEDVDLDELDSTSTIGADESFSVESLLSEADKEKEKEDDENQLPPIIRKIIYEFSDSYKSRSMLHKDMGDLPEDNSPDTVSKRKALVNAIAALSARMKVLYDFRKQYEDNGTIPTDEDLNVDYHDPDAAEKEDDALPIEEIVLPESVDELKKVRRSEATKLTRARNMLLYQQEAKPKPVVENPMPDCPKRVKYQKKVDRLESLIKRIDYLIAERS